jgi:hypothetical protein
MAALDEGVLQAVVNENFKAVAGQAAVLANMNLQAGIEHMNRMRGLFETTFVKSVESLHGTDVPEGLGIAAAQRGDLAKQISDLAAAVASMQASIKAGQTTPPQTGAV